MYFLVSQTEEKSFFNKIGDFAKNGGRKVAKGAQQTWNRAAGGVRNGWDTVRRGTGR